MTTERVSDRDREYMRRLGEWKAESHAEAVRRHQARSPGERLAISEQMSRDGRTYARNDDRSDDEPWKLLDRARELGLLKPE